MKKITATDTINAAIVLSDGDYLLGKGIGIEGETFGEICFNTGMTGYQEVLTDPSYAGQLITFTFPHIGNVGTNGEDNESKQLFCKGLIIRDAITSPSNFRSEGHLNDWLIKHQVVGVSEVDTRKLTRNIGKKGARVAIIKHVKPGQIIDLEALQHSIANEPTLLGRDLTKEVTTQTPYTWHEGTFKLGQTSYQTNCSFKWNVVAVDYGIKHTILRCLSDAEFNVTVVPSTCTYADIMSYKPNGVFLSNGPGDPFATAEYAVPVIKELLENKVPIFGICLGNQLLSIACDLGTVKMHQGHRGVNQPVKNLETGQVEITSQNHGFCVSKENLPEDVEVTHISLFDGSVEGVRHLSKPAFSVQYHPESSPGPHDSRYLFDRFSKLMSEHASV